MITVKVEGTVGSSILDVIAEMQEFSAKLDVCTQQDVNGITVLVFPHTVPSELNERYKKAADLNRTVVS